MPSVSRSLGCSRGFSNKIWQANFFKSWIRSQQSFYSAHRLSLPIAAQRALEWHFPRVCPRLRTGRSGNDMGKNDKAWHNASCTRQIVQQFSRFALLRAAVLCTSMPINQILLGFANHLSCHVLPHFRKSMQIMQRWSQTSDLGSPHVSVTNSSWFKLVWLVHQCTSWIVAWYGQSVRTSSLVCFTNATRRSGAAHIPGVVPTWAGILHENL